MNRADRYYFEARAEEEIERAKQSTDTQAIASHYYLAELYLERLNSLPRKSDPASASPGR